MGGLGSGRYQRPGGVKTPVEHCLCLGVRALQQAEFLQPGRGVCGRWAWGGPPPLVCSFDLVTTGQGGGLLDLRRAEEEEGWPGFQGQTLVLETSIPNWGGLRWWLRCGDCGKRQTKLYLPRGRGYFACRNCHNLSYWSRQENHRPCALLCGIAANLGYNPREMHRIMRRQQRFAARGGLR